MIQFTPLKDFRSEELSSDYCVGLSYTARDQDKTLLALLPTWIDEGNVRLVTSDAPMETKVSGVGKVE